MYIETAPAITIQCAPTGGVLPGTLGPDRVRAFVETNKLPVLDAVTMSAVGKHANPVYLLDLDFFLGLLKKFKAPTYNGIRVYFACYPDVPNAEERRFVPAGMEGQLTLIFVPTFEDGSETGIDDESQCWHLGSDGQLIHLYQPGSVPEEKDIATRWVMHYRYNRRNHLDVDGKTATGNGFEETHSHWYDMKTIAGDGADDKGLLFYINCARQPGDNPVIELYIQWAAFLHTEDPAKYPKYQLSIIFYLRQQKDPPPTRENLFPVANPIAFGSIMSESADTGLPCPPLTYCPPGGFLSNC